MQAVQVDLAGSGSSRAAVRSISATPGRKASRLPSASPSARQAAAVPSSILFGGAAEMDDFDVMAAAAAFDHRRAAHQVGEARAVERRRHGEQPEVGTQRGLGVERQRQAEVGIQASLVDLVEQHRGHAGELGIGLDALEEDALGEHQDPGARRPPGVERAA